MSEKIQELAWFLWALNEKVQLQTGNKFTHQSTLLKCTTCLGLSEYWAPERNNTFTKHCNPFSICLKRTQMWHVLLCIKEKGLDICNIILSHQPNHLHTVEYWTTYHHTDEFFGMEVISWDIQPHHLPLPSQSGWNLYWALHHTGASTRMITHKETGACSEYLNCSSPRDILVCWWCRVGGLLGIPHYTQISFSRFLE